MITDARRGARRGGLLARGAVSGMRSTWSSTSNVGRLKGARD